MVVTVVAMSAGRDVRADHGPYIRAVCRAIEARDVRVAADLTGSGHKGRSAVLTLRPDQNAFAGPVPAEAAAWWDEETGWSLQARPGPAGGRIGKGLDVLPGPGDVAAWVVVALAHPELTPSYEDGQFRAHAGRDPGFEARLSRYVAAS